MNITLNKATEDDFTQLIALFKEFAAFEKLEHLMINNVEKMKAEQEHFNCFVVKNSVNEIIGYVTYFYAYYTWTGKAIYMDDLFVKEAYRGKGIGNKLIQQVIEVAKESNCSKMRWQVSNWNEPAIKFYKSLGAEINTVEQNCDLSL